ncbi:hypothetical protein [uncultured Sunxiuqinia sp.]|nr:hypothetical protein [uncultured Sunxiuqinia sp.]
MKKEENGRYQKTFRYNLGAGHDSLSFAGSSMDFWEYFVMQN